MPNYNDPGLKVVAKALKRYGRKKGLREFAVVAIWSVGAIVPHWQDFGRTDTLIWYVGLLCFMMFEFQRRHIRAMQVRLAQMHDTLNKIAGEAVDGPNEQLVGEFGEA